VIFPTLFYKILIKGVFFSQELFYKDVVNIVSSFFRGLQIIKDIDELYIPIYYPHFEYALVIVDLVEKHIYYVQIFKFEYIKID